MVSNVAPASTFGSAPAPLRAHYVSVTPVGTVIAVVDPAADMGGFRTHYPLFGELAAHCQHGYWAYEVAIEGLAALEKDCPGKLLLA